MPYLYIYIFLHVCVCVCLPSVHGCVWKSEDSWGVLTQLVLILLTVSLTGTEDSMIRLNWLASETPRESSCLKLLNAVVLEMELRSLCLSGKHFIDQTLQTAPVYFFLTLKLLIDWLIDSVIDWLTDEGMCGCHSVPVEVRGWFSGAVFHFPPCWGLISHLPIGVLGLPMLHYPASNVGSGVWTQVIRHVLQMHSHLSHFPVFLHCF